MDCIGITIDDIRKGGNLRQLETIEKGVSNTLNYFTHLCNNLIELE